MTEAEKALLPARRSYSAITDATCGLTEGRAPAWWRVAFSISAIVALIGAICLVYLVSTGVGVWGNNHPVAWAWDITNFVFWIGIGHAGTLISAVLLLARQRWRSAIHRTSEAMTLFAVICAAIYPTFHLGRAWMVWFIAPVPNANGIWPNFASPLLWDTFAIGTYFTVSLLFCYIGLIPDFATLRDRARTKTKRFVYGLLALGWRGSARHWSHYKAAYLLLAGLSTPLVFSVHSIVSCDFAATVLPGWHTTIFPPYFISGAIFGGLAMVLTILIPLRAASRQVAEIVSVGHVEIVSRVMLFAGLLVAYSYIIEIFVAWQSGNPFERAAFEYRIFGPVCWAFWGMVACNVLLPQLFWFRAFRTRMLVVWIVAVLANLGMWLERFVIIVTTLTHDFLPSSWAMYHPTWVDIGTFAGTCGLFLALFLLFIRYLPVASAFEIKELVARAREVGR